MAALEELDLSRPRPARVRDKLGAPTSFRFSDRTIERIEALAKAAETNQTQIVRYGVKLLETAFHNQEAGGTLKLCSPDGTEREFWIVL